MSKAVLISIQPQWCKLIANGEKTFEVRKTKPKVQTPFKAYIYCTNNNVLAQSSMEGYYFNAPRSSEKKLANSGSKILNGKIIGEFVCDTIECVGIPYPAYSSELDRRYTEKSCINYGALHEYCGHGNLYFWHISDLKIYDKPKELSEFRVPCAEYERDNPRCGNCGYYYSESNEAIGFYDECCCDGLKYLEKPPQSWRYVEEV